MIFFHTAPGLGQPCINSRQSKEKIPHFISDSDKQCRCQQGYLKLNNSCSQGSFLRNVVFLFIVFLNLYVSMYKESLNNLKHENWVNNVRTTHNAMQQQNTPCVTKANNADVSKAT